MQASDSSTSNDPLLGPEDEKDVFDARARRAQQQSGWTSTLTPRRRRFLFATCAVLSASSLLVLCLYALRPFQPDYHPPWNFGHGTSESAQELPAPQCPSVSVGVSPTTKPYNAQDSLQAGPTMTFRQNLRSDLKYITSWPGAGWTNDVMTMGNLIYLSTIMDRIPILPKFTPSHIGGDVPHIAFGDVFDVPRLSKELGRPVLEWRDVKDEHSEQLEELGCWSLWPVTQYEWEGPHGSASPDALKLDVSYTVTPKSVKLIPDFQHDKHALFWSIAQLGWPEMRQKHLGTPMNSSINHVQIAPDEHLFCIDYLYYMAVFQAWEWEYDYGPQWRDAGQYMHWAPSLMDITNVHVRRALGLSADAPVPPYISIHVRHHDFAQYCNPLPLEECFAPLSAYERRVREVKAELLALKGLQVDHVIMTSDESDPEWWAQVEAYGWKHIDFVKERTEEVYGKWYPVLIDAVIQSSGAGFVGTHQSTMSLVARRRTESWQKGPTRTVMWGKPGADDHEDPRVPAKRSWPRERYI